LCQKIKYDICLISAAFIIGLYKKEGIFGMGTSAGKFCRCVVRFAMCNKMRFNYAFKKIKSSEANFNRELVFYKKYLNNIDFECLLENYTFNLKKNNYLSYEVMLKGDTVVSTFQLC
jgi:hypothetical protein